MSVYGGMPIQPGLVTPGMPMGGMVPGVPMSYGTPYHANSLGMTGLGSEFGGPMVESYPPTIARTGSFYTPSVYGDRRSLYEADLYDRDRYYDDDYRRGRSYYDDDDYYRYRRSSSRASRRSRRRDYDDYYYDDDRYYDDGRYYGRRRSSSYYPSSSGYHSSSGRKREALSFIMTRKGDVKVLRDGEERFGDRMRRMLGINPKGINVVRTKPGERLAAHISR